MLHNDDVIMGKYVVLHRLFQMRKLLNHPANGNPIGKCCNDMYLKKSLGLKTKIMKF